MYIEPPYPGYRMNSHWKWTSNCQHDRSHLFTQMLAFQNLNNYTIFRLQRVGAGTTERNTFWNNTTPLLPLSSSSLAEHSFCQTPFWILKKLPINTNIGPSRKKDPLVCSQFMYMLIGIDRPSTLNLKQPKVHIVHD